MAHRIKCSLLFIPFNVIGAVADGPGPGQIIIHALSIFCVKHSKQSYLSRRVKFCFRELWIMTLFSGNCGSWRLFQGVVGCSRTRANIYSQCGVVHKGSTWCIGKFLVQHLCVAFVQGLCLHLRYRLDMAVCKAKT